MSAPTFAAALAVALRSDPARPLVTFYDDSTGERVELSVTTYANWVAKTASLLQDELEVERGALVSVDLPTHWLGTVWLGAAWSLGASVTDDAALRGQADVVVCGPHSLEAAAVHAERVPVLALSLRPLGARFTEPLPPGVTDYGAVVLGQPDAFTPYDPATGGDAAWQDASGSLSQAELLSTGPLDSEGVAGGRLLTDVNPCSREGLRTLVGPVVAGGGTVWVRNPDLAQWSHRRQTERADAELRSSAQPPRS